MIAKHLASLTKIGAWEGIRSGSDVWFTGVGNSLSQRRSVAVFQNKILWSRSEKSGGLLKDQNLRFPDLEAICHCPWFHVLLSELF